MAGPIFTPDAMQRAVQTVTAAPAPDWFEHNAPPDSSSAPFARMFSAPMVAAMGDVGDLISTYRNMARGAGDANPTLVQGKPGLSAGILGAEDVAVQLALHRLSASHPTLAKALGYSEGALGAANTIRNSVKFAGWDAYQKRGGQ